jgi:preprotein translocase subunit SecA
MVTAPIRSAQTQVEAQNFEIRKNVLKYDDVLNRQRLVIYAERRRVLEGEDLTSRSALPRRHHRGLRRRGHRRGLPRGVGPRAAVDRAAHALPGGRHRRGGLEAEAATRRLSRDSSSRRSVADARRLRGEREESSATEVMRELERRVMLSVLDRKWREHLYEMDYLQEGIGLRAMAQRDPLVEYQREGFDLFAAMMDAIKEESVGLLFNVEVVALRCRPRSA